MAPLHSESIELPKNERALSESFGGAQVPLSDLPVPERTIAVQETTDPTGSSHRSPDLTHTREAPEDFPEGGYGWVVVLACSVISFFFGGLTYSWGIVQARLTQSRLAGDSQLSFIGSTTITLISVAALINLLPWIRPAAKQLFNKELWRLVRDRWPHLGFGTSLTFMVHPDISDWGWRISSVDGVANGLVFARNGLGGGVISIALNSLVDRVGISWTFRILGLSAGLFCDPKFVLLFLGSGIATFPLLVPPFIIPLYANSVGASASLASWLLATFNLASAVGRVGFGVLGDSIGPITALVLALTIWPASSSIAPLVAFIVINGFGSGGFFSLIPSVVGSVYGNTRTANALAMTVSGWAFGYFLVGPFRLKPVLTLTGDFVDVGSPIAGWVLQVYGSSSAGRAALCPAIYYAGSLALGSTGLIAGMRMLLARKLFVYA
ncbi:MFS general substrate transporter [Lactarius psammicola]|nr:MFS general substrate transporter [Lactarius psammicola]